MKTLGILGGMGPEATADLYLEVIRIFQNKYGAKYDSDFPQILVNSIPLQDVVEGLEKEAAVISMLIWGVKKLEAMGAEFIAIACNTVQIYLPQMRSAVSIPILSIPEETAKEIKAKGFSKVGLLGTKMTVNSTLFDRECWRKNTELIKPTPKQLESLTQMIMGVLAGRKTGDLREIIKTMSAKGAEAIILGCTELPLVVNQASLKLLDTTKILAQACVKECRQNIYKQ